VTVINEQEIEILKEGGSRLAAVIGEVSKRISPGVETKELDSLAERLIREGGDEPSFLLYVPAGSKKPYPASLCISVNDEVVHGIPGERVLCKGDIVGLDLGLKHKGLYVDMAVTLGVGGISYEDKRLLEITKKALNKGISATRIGNRIGDIGFEIESFIKRYRYGIVKALGGHGVGREVHEGPFIRNYGKSGTGPKILEGSVLAIEPMINIGGGSVFLDREGFTWKTSDGRRSAHFEHTVLVTRKGPVILTIEDR